jgi:CO/xanthine dehydrogenase Mo-binding subunit
MIGRTTRREFLVGTGALIVGFSLSRSTAALGQASAKPVAIDQVDSFLSVGADGTVTVFTGKVDLGTGIRTALRQIAAEELDVRFDQIRLVEGDTAVTPDQGPTWGSLSIQVGGVQIRQAAATARKALVEMASKRLGAPVGDLEVRYGIVRIKADPTKSLAYGELIGDRRLDLKVDKSAPLKDPSAYTIVGKSVPRVDIPAKVTGEFTYMQDFRVPGMLHARVIHPPAIGAELRDVDESSVKDVKTLKRVVRIKNFLAVVAGTEWDAVRAAEKLRANWSSWAGLPEMAKIYDYVRATPIAKDEEPLKVGDAPTALAGAARKLAATYEFAIHTHGSIGPSCAVADVRDGTVTIWSASQAGHFLRKQVGELLGMPESAVRVIYLDGAGCYGRNGHEDAACDAALLSRELGQPVRVQWMRHDEHGWDPKGPPTVVDVRGGLDAAGNVVAWQSEFWIPKTEITAWPTTIAATLAGFPHKPAINPGNVHQNAVPPYAFANAHVVAHRLESTPFRPSWIRTPGRMQNTYANECFMDELAAAAGVDPIEFRLRYLKDPRGVEVLNAAAERAKWKRRASPRPGATASMSGVGRGVSYVRYENVRTYVAAIAEVEASRRSGEVRVRRIVVAHDCGQIVNPDGLRNQIEGNVIQTLSRTLKEELTWDRSRVTSVDWASYPILRFPDVPEIDIVLLDRPKDVPWGAGEPAAAVVPSAVANAIFDAIGVRVRRIPFTPERMRAAST